MKRMIQRAGLLVLLVLPFALSAQTVVLDYMYVELQNEELYLQVEKEWKKIHEARIDAGLMTGWQLWRKRYAAASDPYQYITIGWYKNWEHTFKTTPENFWEGIQEVNQDLFEKTLASRTMVKTRVMHGITGAENNHAGALIKINYMQPAPGKRGEYIEFEREVIKPVFEEEIRRGRRASWGLWTQYPYGEGEISLVTVDGYENAEQMFTSADDNLFKEVHPDMDQEATFNKIGALRTIKAVEIWELVDSVSSGE